MSGCLSNPVGVTKKEEFMGRKDGSAFMLPFVTGGTTLLGGLALLELVSRGEIRSPDNMADVYAALVGAYAGAGELKHWVGAIRKRPLEEEDPRLARARKGGFFVAFWLVLLTAAVLWRVADATVPMPHELKAITLRVVGIFFVTYSSRRLRAAPKASLEEAARTSDKNRLLEAVIQTPEGLTRRGVAERFPSIHPRTMLRLLNQLLEEGHLERHGHPNSAEARYAVRRATQAAA
jgi:hypothetical protein